MTPKILHIVNFIDTQPAYNLSKFLSNDKKCEVHILFLPSHQPSQEGFNYKNRYPVKGKVLMNVNFFIPFSLPQKIQIVLNYCLNAYFALLYIFKFRYKYDFGIGETNFGGFIVFIFKTLGFVKKSIFMNGDVVVKRNNDKKLFDFDILSRVQILLRTFAYKNDLIWYTSEKVLEYDRLYKLNPKACLILPGVTIDIAEMNMKILNKVKLYDIGYIGRLEEETGIDLLFDALKLLNQNSIMCKVAIIGGSDVKIKHYQKKCKELEIQNMVDFHGRVESRSEALEKLSKSMFGYAMYQPTKSNSSKYADNGKVKDYIQSGIPVLVTEGFYAADDGIVASNGFLEIDFSATQLALHIEEQINLLTSNSILYQEMKAKTVNFGNKFDYRIVFEKLWDAIVKL
jgi:glycosyltransferase involved in cell wall biosynthesis